MLLKRWLTYTYLIDVDWEFTFDQVTDWLHMSDVMRKLVLAIYEQQRCRSACASAQSDQHLCCSLLKYLLNPKFQYFSLSLWLSRPVWALRGRKPRRQVFSWRGSYTQRLWKGSFYKIVCLRLQPAKTKFTSWWAAMFPFVLSCPPGTNKELLLANSPNWAQYQFRKCESLPCWKTSNYSF